MPQVTFSINKKIFFNYIQTRVEQYFTDFNLKKTGSTKLYSKTIILLGTAVITYVVLLSGWIHPALPLCFAAFSASSRRPSALM